MYFDGKTITYSDTVELLRITLDKKLHYINKMQYKLDLNCIYKIFVTKEIIKPKLFPV